MPAAPRQLARSPARCSSQQGSSCAPGVASGGVRLSLPVIFYVAPIGAVERLRHWLLQWFWLQGRVQGVLALLSAVMVWT